MNVVVFSFGKINISINITTKINYLMIQTIHVTSENESTC